MTYLGRMQLGTYLDIYWQIRSSGMPTLPDAVPTIKITKSSNGAVEYSGLMPVADKNVTPGLFCSRLFLGSGFSNGTHSVTTFALVGGNQKIDVRTFEIIPGGNQLGQVVNMTYYHNPAADHLIYQVESGRLMRGKNPSLA